MSINVEVDPAIDPRTPERFMLVERRPGFKRVLAGPATREDCQDWAQEEVEARREAASHDPENIYGLPSIRQSIEKDRR